MMNLIINKSGRAYNDMKWLEVIELRTVDCDQEMLEVQLKKLLTEFEKKMEGQGIRLYRRVSVENDFRIHLFQERERIDVCGSESGYRLVSALKEFGMVNHSIWVETRCS